ncbi:hypothetical protein J3U66_12455 [Gilliamella sp. B2969]|uniref:hypothetical protein n=1 Tax=Gilliamella sp. B2969 TaxID=2818021 RepID=UPI00226A7F0C|nr:hypothetical protein [Gilliamella sp. B2969]MCX8731191.1 hypothetical protein [Gilliamella sp. B2969]
MNKAYITVAICFALFIYVIFDLYQDKKTAQKEVITLTEKMLSLEQQIEKNNKIIAQREQEKSQDAISIKQLHEQMKNVLKNNQCANEYMPNNVSDWMRNGKN